MPCPRRLPSFFTPCVFMLTGLATACAEPGAAGESSDPSFLFPRARHATLIVERSRSVADDGCVYLVVIDSSVAGRLAPSGWVTIYPPAGEHVVSLRTAGDGCGSPAAEMRTRLEPDGQRRLQLVRGATGALQWKDGGGEP